MTMPIKISKDDIDYQFAMSAHNGVSFDPEKRAEQFQNSYVEDMYSFYNEMKEYATNDEQKDILKESLELYKSGYLKHINSILSAKSRTISPMITGPANFPVDRNRKRMDTERKRWEEFESWSEKFYTRTRSKLLNARTEKMKIADDFDYVKKQIIENMADIKNVLDGNKPGFGISYFKNNITKTLNIYARAGNIEVVKLGIALVKQIEETVFNKKIFTVRHKIWKCEEIAKSNIATKNKENEVIFDSDYIKVVRNYAADRVQIYFDDKPIERERTMLKKNGWRWSPKNSVWQRKNTRNAVENVLQICKEIMEYRNNE